MEDKYNENLKNLFIYGVSFANYDATDITNDIITNIRRRFLVSQKSASNKLYRSSNGFNYVYSYNFTVNKPLQWKVTRNKRVVEQIEHLLADKYCVVGYDEQGKDKKRVFFDAKHRWFKTNYYNSVSNENLICSLVPKEFEQGTSILKYMTGAVYPERLFACTMPSCEEVRTRVLSKVPTPDVTALTDKGIVYFMAAVDKDNFERILSDIEQEYAAEIAPEIYVSKEDAEGGFNLSVNDFDMNKNLNRTFDISLAEDFVKEETEELKSESTLANDNDKPAEITGSDTVEQAISDAVKAINDRTSLGIDAEEILSFKINDAQNDDEDVLDDSSDIISIEDNDPSIDQKLRHIDSVIGESALLTADKHLVIGDSVVDDDYISSIIDGIISSAFSISSDNNDADSVDSTAEIFSDIPFSASVSETAFESVEIPADSQVEENVSDASVSESEDATIESVETTETTPSEVSDEEETFVIATTKDFVADNTPDASLESRGEAYYYYGDVDDNGNRNGRGRTLTSDGHIAYEGEYSADKRNGYGSFYFKDGSLCYWGNWCDNVRNGFGVGISSENKAVHAGNWSNNKPVGAGARFDSEGNLIFLSSNCDDKKKGITISDLTDSSFTVRVWSDEADAFIQREINIKDLL